MVVRKVRRRNFTEDNEGNEGLRPWPEMVEVGWSVTSTLVISTPRTSLGPESHQATPLRADG
jgi:hypothetical protein